MKADHGGFCAPLRAPGREARTGVWKEFAFIFNLCQYLRERHFILSPLWDSGLWRWGSGVEDKLSQPGFPVHISQPS